MTRDLDWIAQSSILELTVIVADSAIVKSGMVLNAAMSPASLTWKAIVYSTFRMPRPSMNVSHREMYKTLFMDKGRDLFDSYLISRRWWLHHEVSYCLRVKPWRVQWQVKGAGWSASDIVNGSYHSMQSTTCLRISRCVAAFSTWFTEYMTHSSQKEKCPPQADIKITISTFWGRSVIDINGDKVSQGFASQSCCDLDNENVQMKWKFVYKCKYSHS